MALKKTVKEYAKILAESLEDFSGEWISVDWGEPSVSEQIQWAYPELDDDEVLEVAKEYEYLALEMAEEKGWEFDKHGIEGVMVKPASS